MNRFPFYVVIFIPHCFYSVSSIPPKLVSEERLLAHCFPLLLLKTKVVTEVAKPTLPVWRAKDSITFPFSPGHSLLSVNVQLKVLVLFRERTLSSRLLHLRAFSIFAFFCLTLCWIGVFHFSGQHSLAPNNNPPPPIVLPHSNLFPPPIANVRLARCDT